MNKIPTIFQRDWNGNRGVVDQYTEGVTPDTLAGARATEKLDGANVRVTVRAYQAVRLEKRRNPTAVEKQKGIEEPWYVDADAYGPADKWFYDALKNTDLSTVPDGEWSGEAIGPNVQGNPLNLPTNRIVFFSLGQAPDLGKTPLSYSGLKAWLPEQKSRYGTDCGIEGIVWHAPDGRMFKVKTKDFK